MLINFNLSLSTGFEAKDNYVKKKEKRERERQHETLIHIFLD